MREHNAAQQAAEAARLAARIWIDMCPQPGAYARIRDAVDHLRPRTNKMLGAMAAQRLMQLYRSRQQARAATGQCEEEQAAVDIAEVERDIAEAALLIKQVTLELAQIELMECQSGQM